MSHGRPTWWPPAVVGAAAVALLTVGMVLDPSDSGPALAVAIPLLAVVAAAGLIVLGLRFRQATGVERQQLKWVLYGLAVSVPFFLVGAIGTASASVSAAWALPAAVIPAVAIVVALLRLRLYDVDVVIGRTLLAAGLAGFVTVIYAAIVVGVGAFVGGPQPDPVLSLLASAVVAVAFQPVRRELQRRANRLVYGRRATPYDVLSGFATRVGAAEPSPDALARLAELMVDGTGADPARVWLRVGSELRPAATAPATADAAPRAVDTAASTLLPNADLALPVRDRGELLGVLTIAKPRGERINEADIELVGRLAAASGVVLRNLRLDAELAQRLADLEASRRRLVTAQDEARQRIESELAGGPRAALTTLRSQLSALLHACGSTAGPRTGTVLGQLVAQAGSALDTLDGLAAGVYPPRLAADGLAAALTEQADRAAVPVSVAAAGTRRYRRQTETAVYFSVLEALQNVAKYAGATTAEVRLREDGDRLRFEVADDGVGFDPATARSGTGLQGMTDRLDTVGGTITVRSAPGVGTTIVGEVPVPVDDAPMEAPVAPVASGQSLAEIAR